jgi:hypothetical protein
MYVGDFDGNGSIEQVISCHNGDSSYPMSLRHDLVGVLPYLKKKYLKYEDYKLQTIDDIFTKEQLSRTIKLTAYEMHTSIIVNNKNGTFTLKPLPAEAQFSPVYAINVNDYDGDGNADILMGGNFYQSRPEAGIYDASHGLLLKGNGKGNFIVAPTSRSGFSIKGAVRDIVSLKTKNKSLVLAAKNNDIVETFIKE